MPVYYYYYFIYYFLNPWYLLLLLLLLLYHSNGKGSSSWFGDSPPRHPSTYTHTYYTYINAYTMANSLQYWHRRTTHWAPIMTKNGCASFWKYF